MASEASKASPSAAASAQLNLNEAIKEYVEERVKPIIKRLNKKSSSKRPANSSVGELTLREIKMLLVECCCGCLICSQSEGSASRSSSSIKNIRHKNRRSRRFYMRSLNLIMRERPFGVKALYNIAYKALDLILSRYDYNLSKLKNGLRSGLDRVELVCFIVMVLGFRRTSIRFGGCVAMSHILSKLNFSKLLNIYIMRCCWFCCYCCCCCFGGGGVVNRHKVFPSETVSSVVTDVMYECDNRGRSVLYYLFENNNMDTLQRMYEEGIDMLRGQRVLRRTRCYKMNYVYNLHQQSSISISINASSSINTSSSINVSSSINASSSIITASSPIVYRNASVIRTISVGGSNSLSHKTFLHAIIKNGNCALLKTMLKYYGTTYNVDHESEQINILLYACLRNQPCCVFEILIHDEDHFFFRTAVSPNDAYHLSTSSSSIRTNQYTSMLPNTVRRHMDCYDKTIQVLLVSMMRLIHLRRQYSKYSSHLVRVASALDRNNNKYDCVVNEPLECNVAELKTKTECLGRRASALFDYINSRLDMHHHGYFS